MCDNISSINLSKHFIQHLRTKHVKIRNNFIIDHVQTKQSLSGTKENREHVESKKNLKTNQRVFMLLHATTNRYEIILQNFLVI